MTDLVRVKILMTKPEVGRLELEPYCRETGYKKPPLIARLFPKSVDRVTFDAQPELFNREQQASNDL